MGPQWVIWSSLRAQAEHTAQDCLHIVLEYLQQGQSVPVLSQLHSEVWSSAGISVHQLLPVVSCAIVQHHWEEPGSIILAPSLQILTDTDEVPSLLSLLKAEQAQDSHPTLLRCFSPLIIFLHWDLLQEKSQSSKIHLALRVPFGKYTTPIFLPPLYPWMLHLGRWTEFLVPEPFFEGGTCYCYWEHCFASYRLTSTNKHCHRHSISSLSCGSLSWMKTLAELLVVFFVFPQHYEEFVFLLILKAQNVTRAWGLKGRASIGTVLVLMSSELQKVPIKPRIFPEQIIICSKAFFLLCAQRSVVLVLHLPGTCEAS